MSKYSKTYLKMEQEFDELREHVIEDDMYGIEWYERFNKLKDQCLYLQWRMDGLEKWS